MKVYKNDSTKLPIKSWCNTLEEGALTQAINLSNLPFAFKHIALMPDTHQGYGMPIGGVLAAKDYIIPNAVGVDIGCGMCAIKTKFQDELSKEAVMSIMAGIRQVVPMGVGQNHSTPCNDSEMPKMHGTDFVMQIYDAAKYQMGTLGSGNHFVELQRDEENYLWIMLHSGSRKFGKSICDHYNAIAKKLNQKYFSTVDPRHDLAFLHLHSVDGEDYYRDMMYATEFALLNRSKMMDAIMEVLQDCISKYEKKTLLFDEVNEQSLVNIHHNYAALENHFNHNVIVHRKGATRARFGETGIIPGSQGSSSYIVEGLGNNDSFTSCSHGAGRQMGRKQAQRTLNLEAEIKRMDDQGIVHGMTSTNDLDEATGAYKDIDIVMEEQKDLVKILYKLRPVASLKGG